MGIPAAASGAGSQAGTDALRRPGPTPRLSRRAHVAGIRSASRLDAREMANGLSHSLPQPLDQAPPPAAIGPVRTFLVRGLSYATNQIINHLSASGLRHAWYRHVLGARLGHRAVVEARCVVLFFGPGSLRRNHLLRIGHGPRIGEGCWLDARGAQLSIGNDVRIAPEVAILTTQHDRDDPDFCLLSRPVVIEDQ